MSETTIEPAAKGSHRMFWITIVIALAIVAVDQLTKWWAIENLSDGQVIPVIGDWIRFVLVPNLRSLAVRLLGEKYRYVYAQHLNYFSVQTLGQLGGRVGFEVVATRFTHFNPVVIWQDWRGRGRDVSNAERGELLKQTTALKQKPWLRPVKWLYGLTEKTLGATGLADNVVVVLRKT